MGKVLFRITVAAICAAVSGVYAQSVSTRMDRSKFQIGVWGFKKYVHDEAHVKDLKECGIDFAVDDINVTDRKVLDLFQKYGIGAVVRDVGPRWFGGNGSKSGRMRELCPKKKYENGFRKHAEALKHPAIWMVDLCDEPSALDMEYIGEMCDWIMTHSPETPPFLNLYPCYASVSQNTKMQSVNQLGTKTYAEHIDTYCRKVPVDYLSYDFYVYTQNLARRPSLLCQMYDNFNIVSEACRKTGRSFWYIPQVNSHMTKTKPFEPTSVNRLRFQANSAMAFGAELLCWACWTKGWWTNNVITATGEKTAQYDRLKTVNKELRGISPRYMQYRNTATHYVGFAATNGFEKLGKPLHTELDTAYFRGVRGLESTPFVIGEMVPRGKDDGSRALFAVASGDPYDYAPAVRTLVFKVPAGRQVEALGVNGKVELKRDENGLYSVRLPENSAVLLISRARP